MSIASKRICFVNTTNFFGGGEKWHFEMAKAMMQYFDVCFISSKDSILEKYIKEISINYRTLSISNLSYLNPIIRHNAKKILEDINPDLVIINGSSELKLLAPICQQLNIRLIYRRGSAIPIKPNLLNKRLFGMLSHLIVNSIATSKSILANDCHLIDSRKIKLIYNPIDTDLFAPSDKADTNEIIIGNAGRIVEQKNQMALLDLAQELESRNIKHKILIAGAGPQSVKLQSEIIRRDLSSVLLLGNLANMPRFYNSLDLFVLTSKWEGFAYVVAEAMACGVVPIVFNISNMEELIDSGSNGFLIDFGNIAGMASMIEDFSKNKNLLKPISQSARRKVLTQFDSRIIIDDLKRFLEEV